MQKLDPRFSIMKPSNSKHNSNGSLGRYLTFILQIPSLGDIPTEEKDLLLAEHREQAQALAKGLTRATGADFLAKFEDNGVCPFVLADLGASSPSDFIKNYIAPNLRDIEDVLPEKPHLRCGNGVVSIIPGCF